MGNFKLNSILNLIEAVVTLILSTVLCIFYSIPGILLGAIIAGSLRTLGYIIYAHKQILKAVMIKSFIRLFLNFMLMAAIIFIPFSSGTTSILSWMILAAKVAGITFLVVVLGNLIIDLRVSRDLYRRIRIFIINRRGLPG
jgi:hypothetical protein